MILIVVSKPDPASINIQSQLLDIGNWEEQEDLSFNDNPVYVNKTEGFEFWMVTINHRHLDYDNIDLDLQIHLKLRPETIIYASRHRSASGMRTLTVHPVGNFETSAEYGGKPQELVMASPYLMTNAYRILYNKVKSVQQSQQFEYSVSFEATHHGPYLETPTFFIEIGSDEDAWVDVESAKLIAETILELKPQEARERYPVALGVGGGHYTPRISDVVRAKKLVVGHMLPTYAIGTEVSAMISEEILQTALKKTPEATLVYFHRKALKKPVYIKLKDWFEANGIKAVRSSDLEDIE